MTEQHSKALTYAESHQTFIVLSWGQVGGWVAMDVGWVAMDVVGSRESGS